MLGAFIIVLREVIEAGLIVGIVLAATRGVPERGFWVALGVLGGLFGAAVIAGFGSAITDAFEGSGQDLLNAGILILATLMLTIHNVWMAKHGAELAREMRAVGHRVTEGETSLVALSVVIGLAVLREGAEVVLFMAGIVASGTDGGSLLAGSFLGLLGGALVSALSYFGLLSIPTRYVFSVTSWILVLVASGLASQAVQYLSAADLVTVLDRPVWDTSAILSENSLLGRLLRALVGYTARPTGAQLLTYIATALIIVLLMRLVSGGGTRPKGGEAHRQAV